MALSNDHKVTLVCICSIFPILLLVSIYPYYSSRLISLPSSRIDITLSRLVFCSIEERYVVGLSTFDCSHFQMIL